MKIIRSEGHSYTEADDTSRRKLRRGLRRDRDTLLTPAKYKNQLEISPARLGNYLTEDYRLVLRQVISALDKVITKPRGLGGCHLETYVDRTHLATALWARLERHFGPSIRKLDNDDNAFLEFKKTWRWKVHPYAESECNWTNPKEYVNGGPRTYLIDRTPPCRRICAVDSVSGSGGFDPVRENPLSPRDLGALMAARCSSQSSCSVTPFRRSSRWIAGQSGRGRRSLANFGGGG